MPRKLFLPVVLLLAACGGTHESLPVVDHVDLQRYTGTWHEIARLPQWFQRGCYNSTATYSRNDDGSLKVVNRCQREDDTTSAVGVAQVVAGSNNAKLKVRFKNWFSNLFPTIARGDYWILHLDDDYEVVMIGEPEREYLWILARTPTLKDDHYRKLVDKAARLGFPVENLKRNRNLVPDDAGT